MNAVDGKQRAALHHAAGKQASPEVVSLLLQGGADVHAIDKHEKTVIHVAAEHRAGPEVLGLLIAAGADPASCNPPLTSAQVQKAMATTATGLPADNGDDDHYQHRQHHQHHKKKGAVQPVF